MPDLTIEFTGFESADQKVQELAREYGPKNAEAAFRNPIRKALQPMFDRIQALTPVDSGALQQATRLRIAVPSGRREQADVVADDTAIEGRVGWFSSRATPVTYRQMLAVEFGNEERDASPVIRPTFQSGARGALARFGRELGNSIDRTAARLRRRADRGTLKIR